MVNTGLLCRCFPPRSPPPPVDPNASYMVGNGCLPHVNGNGHIPGHYSSSHEMDSFLPMLTDIQENEKVDSKVTKPISFSLKLQNLIGFIVKVMLSVMYSNILTVQMCFIELIRCAWDWPMMFLWGNLVKRNITRRSFKWCIQIFEPDKCFRFSRLVTECIEQSLTYFNLKRILNLF